MYAAQDEAIPNDKVDLYIRVLALAEKGADGEREQAERTLAKLRLKYPGIEAQAEEQIRATKPSGGRAGGKPPGPTPKESFWSAYTKTFESVTRILDEMSAILSDVKAQNEATEAIDDVLDASVKQVRVGGAEKFRLIIDLDADVLSDVLSSLEGDEKAIRAITDHIGKRVAESLSGAFLGDDEDDEGEDE